MLWVFAMDAAVAKGRAIGVAGGKEKADLRKEEENLEVGNSIAFSDLSSNLICAMRRTVIRTKRL